MKSRSVERVRQYNAVFPIAHDLLLQIAAGQVADVTEDKMEAI
jgi:hypothetical protein